MEKLRIRELEEIEYFINSFIIRRYRKIMIGIFFLKFDSKINKLRFFLSFFRISKI